MARAAAAAPAKRWAREYETIYIMRPDVSAEQAEKVSDRVAEALTRLGGKLVAVDNWGKRKLAYNINKQSRGVFVYIRFVAHSDAVAEIERNLRLLDDVVRFQTVLLQDGIDMDAVEVDPEAVKFLHVEVEEEEAEPDAEQKLGMGAPPPRSRRAPSDDSDSDDDSDDDSDSTSDDSDSDSDSDSEESGDSK